MMRGLSMQRTLRGMPARVALAGLLAHASVACAHVAPSIAPANRSVSSLAQSLVSSPHARTAFTSSTANRKDAVPGSDKPASRRPAAKAAPARGTAPVVTATAPGPGQSGYVHYFVIDTPDGERETQIGIELPDGRIAWSFPELGVVVSPFIASGELPVNGRHYAVQHLYAIRPFPDKASMLALQKDLLNRVIPWVEDGTLYCNQAARSSELCLSCLGFVMRVLYPSRAGFLTPLPADFRRAASGLYITTEDLLLYQAGLHDLQSRQARLDRIGRLAVPQRLREDLIELVSAMEADGDAGGVTADAPKKSSGKKRAGTRSDRKTGQRRSSQPGKL